tara:strand:- start:4 stop:255 length:252 start_codon:yes stop_codon:yes gene_type:complete
MVAAAMVGNPGAVDMLLDYEGSPVDVGERIAPVNLTAKQCLMAVQQRVVAVPNYDRIYTRLHNAETFGQRALHVVTGQPPAPP